MVHSVIVGLGFGDEGKGRIVDYLCATNDIKAVIRFSGGAQAAHNVITPDGRHHTFAQFGSGTFHGVPTYLSRYMMVNPFNLMREYEALTAKVDFDPLERLFVSHASPIITPYHRRANQLREIARGGNRHGSCGQGIGETRSLELDGIVLRASWMRDWSMTSDILTQIYHQYTEEFGDDFTGSVDEPDEIAKQYLIISGKLNYFWDTDLDLVLDSGDCVFEGSQGVLLDEWYGFHPYTTWSTTTPENALKILGDRESKVIGVTRSYQTRHGAGPFPTEVEPEMDESHPEPHNGTGVYQGTWRRGLLDLTLLSYAVRCCERIDAIAVTHLDRLTPIRAGYAHLDELRTKAEAGRPKTDLVYQEELTKLISTEGAHSGGWLQPADGDELCQFITAVTGVPVTVTAYGPTWEETRVLQLQ